MLTIDTVQNHDGRSLASFIDLADEVFLREKKRSGSVLIRYPNLFQPENFRNLYTVWCGDELAGVTAIREFECSIRDTTLRGAMVGLVAVRKQYRGQGIGCQMMERVTTIIRQRAINFAVLWATSPAFYAAHGWVPHDIGLYGDLAHPSPKSNSSLVPSPSAVWYSVEARRLNNEGLSIRRTFLDYCVTPSGVEKVLCFRSQNDVNKGAYAIVGVRGETGVLYEMIGDTAYFAEIWEAVSSQFSSISVNDHSGSISHKWLKSYTALQWHPQTLSLWLRCNNEVNYDISSLHIPYFDRI